MTHNAEIFDLNTSPIHLIHRARQRAEELFAARMPMSDLTARQFAILFAINAQPGLNQHALSQAIGSDRSTVSELVKRLENRGLVRRERSSIDNRQILLNLTDEGAACISRCIPAAQQADFELIADLPRETAESLIRLLVGIIDTSQIETLHRETGS